MKWLSLVAVVVVACRSPQQTIEASATTATSTTASASAASASAVASSSPIVDAAVDARRALVDAWNAAHNAHDADALSPLYANDVHFYLSEVGRDECVSTKKDLFAKNPDFAQTIRDVRFETLGDASTDTLVRFVKTVTMRGKSTDYPSYLEIAQSGRAWIILTESDDVSDRNIRSHCTTIDWKGEWPYDGVAELSGRIEKAEGFNTTDMEPYLKLTLDKPACTSPRSFRPATNAVQVFTFSSNKTAPDLDKLVGKHVRVKGSAFAQHTAHHHELVVMSVDSATVLDH